jgi:hypothetical protein
MAVKSGAAHVRRNTGVKSPLSSDDSPGPVFRNVPETRSLWRTHDVNARSKTAMRRTGAFILFLLGAAFLVGGLVSMFAPEGDLGRSNLLLIGFAYIVVGLFLGSGGYLLLNRMERS